MRQYIICDTMLVQVLLESERDCHGASSDTRDKPSAPGQVDCRRSPARRIRSPTKLSPTKLEPTPLMGQTATRRCLSSTTALLKLSTCELSRGALRSSWHERDRRMNGGGRHAPSTVPRSRSRGWRLRSLTGSLHSCMPPIDGARVPWSAMAEDGALSVRCVWRTLSCCWNDPYSTALSR